MFARLVEQDMLRQVLVLNKKMLKPLLLPMACIPYGGAAYSIDMPQEANVSIHVLTCVGASPCPMSGLRSGNTHCIHT